MTNRNPYPWIVSVVVLSCLMQYFWFTQGFYSISWDEAGRTLDANNWLLQGDALNLRAIWLPFYRLVVGLGLMVHPDLIVTPRVVTGAFGVIALLATVWLSFELFRDRTTTCVTAVLALFLPVRVALSLAPLSSMMFASFIIVALACLARWASRESSRCLFLSASLFAASGTIRYEGWIFSAIFLATVLFLKLRDRKFVPVRELALSLIVVSVFPVFILASHLIEFGNLSVLVNGASTRYVDFRTVVAKNPLVEFIGINMPSFNIVGLAGVVSAFAIDRRVRVVIVVPSLALLAVSAALLVNSGAQSGPSWRMTGVWSMILVPFTAYFITRLSRRASGRYSRRLVAGAIVALFVAASIVHTHRIKTSSWWAFPPGDRELGRNLENVIAQRDTKILIESSKYFYLNVLVASQHPEKFILNSIPQHPNTREPLIEPDKPEGLRQLTQLGVSVLVFKSARFRDWLDLSDATESIGEYAGWTAYRVVHDR